MRLDHIALRVPNRAEAVQFYIDAFGYSLQQEFEVSFDDGTKAMCSVLQPPERLVEGNPHRWTMNEVEYRGSTAGNEMHIPPELFISQGDPGSIVDRWVQSRGGKGGIHHMAYQVEDVKATMIEWQQKGWAEFTSDVLSCPEDDLDQIFTKPNKYSGIIYEFIKRGKDGFCNKNVKDLMLSTKDIK